MKKYMTNPGDIEKQSMRTISEILGEVKIPSTQLQVVKRVIHTTADFQYAEILKFSNNVIERTIEALHRGRHIVTDTRMALSGINKRVLANYGVEVKCYMSDEDVAREAKAQGTTRAMASMKKAIRDERNGIFVFGNAPTALFKLLELMEAKAVEPDVIIGVPVGFVGAAESKEELSKFSVPYILTEGCKGGSGVAAAIMNAIIYRMKANDE